jgi:phosphate transport system protein
MSQHLRSDLDRLQRSLLYVAAQVEEAVRKSVLSMLERDQDMALEVIEGDRVIDRKEVELEEDCLKVLALHRPVANDLRFVTACLKINNDLERIGDLASNIAKRAAYLTTLPPVEPPSRLREMMELGMGMLRRSLDAFVATDGDVARAVVDEDRTMNHLHSAIVREAVQKMESRAIAVDPGLQLFLISKSLERIADHATNIAEDVVYMVEGDIIRHWSSNSED